MSLFGPLNGVVLNGTALKLITSGTASANSFSEAVFLRIITYSAQQISSEATVPDTIARRIITPENVTFDSNADSSVDEYTIFTRIVDSSLSINSTSTATAERLAKVTGLNESTAVLDGKAKKLAKLSADQTVGLSSIADFAPVVRLIIFPELSFARSLTFENSNNTFVTQVRQISGSGTSIARAQTRGLHSRLARSKTEAIADSTLNSNAVIIARDIEANQISSKAFTEGQAIQLFEVKSKTSAYAESIVSPDISFDGDNFVTTFAFGTGFANSNTVINAKRLAKPVLLSSNAKADSISIPANNVDINGVTKANANTKTNDNFTVVNSLIFNNGQSVSKANTTAKVANLLSFEPEQLTAQSNSESSITKQRLFNGLTESNAVTSNYNYRKTTIANLDAIKTETIFSDNSNQFFFAKRVESNSIADAETFINITTFSWIFTNSTVFAESTISDFFPVIIKTIELKKFQSESVSNAEFENVAVKIQPNNLISNSIVTLPWVNDTAKGARRFIAVNVSLNNMLANTNLGKNQFRINITENAPLSRNVIIKPDDRTFIVKSANREFRV